MDQYYKEQLRLLREETMHFARLHPALAPMLLTQGEDPDVERILEGVAYLCGKIHERMDQGTPELIQALIRIAFPQALLPTPSATVMHFKTVPGFTEPIMVQAGTELASSIVDGVACRYSTVAPFTVLPLRLTALPTPQATGDVLRVSLRLESPVPLRGLLPSELRLFIAGEYSMASERFHALLTRLTRVEVSTGTGTLLEVLQASAVRHAPFPLEDHRLPPWQHRNRSYMEIIRYFVLPQQLLFIGVHGLDRLRLPDGATRLDLTFCLQKPFETLPSFEQEWAMLNVVPAVNVFKVSAEPLVVDHLQEEYLVRPRDAQSEAMEICSVDRVTSLLPGGVSEPCVPFENVSSFKEVGSEIARLYALRIRPALRGNRAEGGTEHVLTFLTQPGEKPENLARQTLSLDLCCCQLQLPSRLRAGDITSPTDSSPAQAVFTNLIAPTPTLPRILDETLLWRYLSHLNTNLLSCASAEALRSMLELYIPSRNVAPELAAANSRCCWGVQEFTSEAEDRLIRGRLLRGRVLLLTLNPAAFVSRGDMYLFAGVLDRFLSGYATINSYFRLELREAGVGGVQQWSPRLGEKQLL